MEETQEIKHRPYKIMEGDIVSVIRSDVTKDGNDWTFYKVALKNKLEDSQTFYKNLTFKKGTTLSNGTKIKINKMCEYCRHLDKFRDTFYLYIEDYEIIGEKASDAIREYKEESDFNENIVF